LRPFANVDAEGFLLLLAWLVGAIRPGSPCPILVLQGEQGTAKSTLARLCKELIDPHHSALRALPKNEYDLAISAAHQHVLVFDNLSTIPDGMSDALCRLVTGGGISRRKLYSDDEEWILDAKRPIILTGIDDIATRQDLAERCIVLTLEPLGPGLRRDEASFREAWAKVYPGVFGALLDAASQALRSSATVKLDRLPRMADFLRWAAAAAPSFGVDERAVFAAYSANRAHASALAFDASPIAKRVLALVEEHGSWRGTASVLLAELARRGGSLPPNWPRAAHTFSNQLTRVAPLLRERGVSVRKDRHREREIILTKEETPSGSEDASTRNE
jgi:putative DNA primase/helicase